jgi:hypothetical protein
MSDAEYFDYQEFPSFSFGGPPGDYTARVPVSSNEEAEFMIVAVANGAVNVASVIIGSYTNPFANPDISGATTYNDTNLIPGLFFRIPINNMVLPNPVWERIINQRGEVYMHINNAQCALVTIKFRVKILKKIPAPFKTVAPEDEKLVHAMREQKIQEAVLARLGEEYTYGHEPPQQPIIEPITATTAPRSKLGYWGKIIR